MMTLRVTLAGVNLTIRFRSAQAALISGCAIRPNFHDGSVIHAVRGRRSGSSQSCADRAELFGPLINDGFNARPSQRNGRTQAANSAPMMIARLIVPAMQIRRLSPDVYGKPQGKHFSECGQIGQRPPRMSQMRSAECGMRNLGQRLYSAFRTPHLILICFQSEKSGLLRRRQMKPSRT